MRIPCARKSHRTVEEYDFVQRSVRALKAPAHPIRFVMLPSFAKKWT